MWRNTIRHAIIYNFCGFASDYLDLWVVIVYTRLEKVWQRWIRSRRPSITRKISVLAGSGPISTCTEENGWDEGRGMWGLKSWLNKFRPFVSIFMSGWRGELKLWVRAPQGSGPRGTTFIGVVSYATIRWHLACENLDNRHRHELYEPL